MKSEEKRAAWSCRSREACRSRSPRSPEVLEMHEEHPLTVDAGVLQPSDDGEARTALGLGAE